MSEGSSPGAKHVAREVSAGFGELGSEGRESETQVILTRPLRAALLALNPGLPADAYAQAVEQLAQDRSKQIAVNANRDFYRLLKDGVKVKVPDEHGGHRRGTTGDRRGVDGRRTGDLRHPDQARAGAHMYDRYTGTGPGPGRWAVCLALNFWNRPSQPSPPR